jgi:predicted secreted hydrolase
MLLGAGLATAQTSDPADWIDATPGYAWSFPRDHASHPGYRTEWWYFTGHLETEQPPLRRFGYQFILFRIGVTPAPPGHESSWDSADMVMIHAAITDKDRGEHHFSEVLWRAMPLLGAFGAPGDPRLVRARAPAGSDGEWSVTRIDDGFALAMNDDLRRLGFRLTVHPGGPPLLQGPGGFSRKAADPRAASLYYSYTRLATQGTLSLGGETLGVRGRGWMDREFGSSFLGEQQAGWDWFGIQLDDGRDLMLYRLRRDDGGIDWAGGTAISPTSGPRYLERPDWTATPRSFWRSPASGVEYPSVWSVEIPGEGLRLELRPEVAGQENHSRLGTGLAYWEGAVSVHDSEGRRIGEGYVELTGYGDNRPPL